MGLSRRSCSAHSTNSIYFQTSVLHFDLVYFIYLKLELSELWSKNYFIFILFQPMFPTSQNQSKVIKHLCDRDNASSRSPDRGGGSLCHNPLMRKGSMLHQIHRGSIIVSQDRYGRRLSTFTNLPIESRFG